MVCPRSWANSLMLLSAWAWLSSSLGAGTISTVVGTGVGGYNGDGIPATSAQIIGGPNLCLDLAGNMYVADSGNHRVRRVDAVTGLISTVAGTGISGYNGDGIPATSARVTNISGISTDVAGNVYFADVYNHRIRKIDISTGLISTVVGTGVGAFNGNGLPAISTQIRTPYGIHVDYFGSIWFCDAGNNRLRRADPVSGLVVNVAGTGTPGYNGDGIPANTAQVRGPTAIYADLQGNAYIADLGDHRIRRVDAATGLISTVAGTGTGGYNGDAIPATTARLNSPGDLRVDSAGNIFFSDNASHRVRKVDAATGLISTVAGNGVGGYNGDGILATSANINFPTDVALDCYGNLYLADYYNNRLRKVDGVVPPCIVPSPTPSPTAAGSFTPSPTASVTATASPSRTASPSASPTPSFTPTATRTVSPTRSRTASPSATASPTRSPSAVPTVTGTPSPTPTRTASATASPTFSPSPVVSATPTRSPTQEPQVLTLALLPPNPSPARDRVWLPYRLGADAEVRVTVYTVAGERVRALSPVQRLAGVREESWDLANEAGRRVSSGIFIYRVEAHSAAGERREAYSKCAVSR